jgi:hypothetical protein
MLAFRKVFKEYADKELPDMHRRHLCLPILKNKIEKQPIFEHELKRWLGEHAIAGEAVSKGCVEASGDALEEFTFRWGSMIYKSDWSAYR